MLRLALCQLSVTANKAANIANAISHIRAAAKGGADVVVLPECFNCPYDTKCFLEYGEPVPSGETCRAMASVAKESNVTLIAGTIPELGGGGTKLCYNTCVVYNPDGNVAGVYRKIHLFKICTDTVRFDESETLHPGSDPLVVTLPNKSGFRIGIGICFDVRFPALASYYQHSLKTNLIVYPGAFNMVTGPPHWALTCRVRALDTQQYVAMCSPARNTTAGYVAYGHSMVCGPWGDILTEAEEGQGISYADLSLATVEEVRKKLPITDGHRGDLYGGAWGGKKSKI